MVAIPTPEDIHNAHKRIRPFVHRTPVMSSSNINTLSGASLFFKCENFQRAGAFKYRGATNAVLCIDKSRTEKGVATHSSGNHAGALALAAKIRNIPCHVVMPENAPLPKVNAVKHYGADITFCKPTLQSREETLDTIVTETDATIVHPFNNFDVICGQGTAALELLEDHPYLDIILAPVGGGGLLSGTALAARSVNPNIKVIGCEPAGADDAYRSFKSRMLIPSVDPVTIADGLLTSLCEITFHIISNTVNDIITVSETSIIHSMLLVWERMKILIEPSSAVTVAAIIENKELFRGKRVGVILSGGNVDLMNLPFRET